MGALMREETNNAVAYLRALRQYADPPPASPELQSAAAAPPANAPQHQRYQGAEKRRSSRYNCEGSVEMREENCDVHTWSTFTDISLHGCYVEAQATYPVGTVLSLKLEANGIRVETTGTVRVNYPYLGMGIAFSEVNEENRARLKELLGTVSRSAVIMGPGIASALPCAGPLDAVPLISDSAGAVQALVQFFEVHHMLTREDFLRVLTRSQPQPAKK